jgi:hypothetical protein
MPHEAKHHEEEVDEIKVKGKGADDGMRSDTVEGNDTAMDPSRCAS